MVARRVVGLKAALNGNGQYKYKAPEAVVDHLIVGAGVVGLAVARRLAQRWPGKSTYIIERNDRAGEEISSRNSEVIHAGLYYPPNSLKSKLCIRGRQMLYEYCHVAGIPHRKTGKLVVGHDDHREYLQSLHKTASNLRWPRRYRTSEFGNGPDLSPAVPTTLISGSEARSLEPDISSSIVAALLSYETGIIDAHSYMSSLERDITDISEGNATLLLASNVVRVDPAEDADGWIIQVRTGDECYAVQSRTVVNASGLSANLILNSLLPEERRMPMYYARGSYMAYKGPGITNVSHLIYPCPDKKSHAFQHLGTHLTLDLAGNIKFGPNIEWISPEGKGTSPIGAGKTQSEVQEMYSLAEKDIDYWKSHLVPEDTLIPQMYEAVRTYLPGVKQEKFRPDYVGVRPKLVPPSGPFQDFVFRVDQASDFVGKPSKTRHGGLMCSCLGIESPGLTASLAIAEHVVDGILGAQENNS